MDAINSERYVVALRRAQEATKYIKQLEQELASTKRAAEQLRQENRWVVHEAELMLLRTNLNTREEYAQELIKPTVNLRDNLVDLLSNSGSDPKLRKVGLAFDRLDKIIIRLCHLSDNDRIDQSLLHLSGSGNAVEEFYVRWGLSHETRN